MNRRAWRAAVVCVLALAAAQVVALFAWPLRPAAVQEEFVAGDERLGETFVALDPGEFAGTLLLGGLRGLVTDLLWLRATGAKERGRFYESVALFELISRVQPRFAQVWKFMAHDLAYNIAVEVGEQERWNWFQAGIEAINRGARRNPRSVDLLRFHAWIFFHKGALYSDRILAHDWTGLINPLLRRHAAVPAIAHGPARVVARTRAAIRIVVALREGRTRVGAPMLLGVGDRFHARARVVAIVGDRVILEAAAVDLGDVDGPLRAVAALSNYQVAGRLYRAALALARRQRLRVAAYVRRLIALGIERDGNRLRNAGDHLGALHRYLDSLADWQRTLAWVVDPDTVTIRNDRTTTRESYERNEGRLRRRAAQLARELAPDPFTGRATASAVLERDLLAARMLIAFGAWRRSVDVYDGVRWYDAGAP